MTEIVHKKESNAIVGACFEVYNEKGCGFLEPVYQECLGIEFEYRRIPAIAKPSLVLSYRGRILKHTYAPDYVCFGKIIVELKAVSALTDEHRAQLLNYPARNRFRAWPPREFRALPKTGIRAHCEDSTHQVENGSLQCLPLTHSRLFV
jgi:GxxExxY protein